jgi:26S proteasome regulatory subunit N8
MIATDSSIPVEKVVVHPLVLLSVVDHFNRMKQVGNTRRVCGLLLGSMRNKILDVSNSFASKNLNKFIYYDNIYILKLTLFTNFRIFKVPFDEEDKERDVWFLDHEYLENMYGMFKKVNGIITY